MSEAGVITIKNWRRHQHYKHRNPPWVKLHADLLRDCAWYRGLSDNAARFLIELWLLARRDGGTIPYDSLMILREMGRPSSHKAQLDNALHELASASAVTLAGTDASESLFLPLAAAMSHREARMLAHRGTEVQSIREQSAVASQPAAPVGDLTDGQLMGFVRQHLYVPDGKAPTGYSDGRDVKIIRALRQGGLSGYQIADAIEGVRLMCEAGELGRKRPGEKLTMRALYHTGHGVRPLLFQAQEAVYQRAKGRASPNAHPLATPKGPEHISATLEGLIPPKPGREEAL
jgi:hypothetical protein